MRVIALGVLVVVGCGKKEEGGAPPKSSPAITLAKVEGDTLELFIASGGSGVAVDAEGELTIVMAEVDKDRHRTDHERCKVPVKITKATSAGGSFKMPLDLSKCPPNPNGWINDGSLSLTSDVGPLSWTSIPFRTTTEVAAVPVPENMGSAAPPSPESVRPWASAPVTARVAEYEKWLDKILELAPTAGDDIKMCPETIRKAVGTTLHKDLWGPMDLQMIAEVRGKPAQDVDKFAWMNPPELKLLRDQRAGKEVNKLELIKSVTNSGPLYVVIRTKRRVMPKYERHMADHKIEFTEGVLDGTALIFDRRTQTLACYAPLSAHSTKDFEVPRDKVNGVDELINSDFYGNLAAAVNESRARMTDPRLQFDKNRKPELLPPEP